VRLQTLELVKFNPFAGRGGGLELTKKGKIPFGELSLMLFNAFQDRCLSRGMTTWNAEQPLPRGRLTARPANRPAAVPGAVAADPCQHALFSEHRRWQVYKVGVTTRDIQERIEEIRADLLPTLGTIKIDVLGTCRPGQRRTLFQASLSSTAGTHRYA